MSTPGKQLTMFYWGLSPLIRRGLFLDTKSGSIWCLKGQESPTSSFSSTAALLDSNGINVQSSADSFPKASLKKPGKPTSTSSNRFPKRPVSWFSLSTVFQCPPDLRPASFVSPALTRTLWTLAGLSIVLHINGLWNKGSSSMLLYNWERSLPWLRTVFQAQRTD